MSISIEPSKLLISLKCFPSQLLLLNSLKLLVKSFVFCSPCSNSSALVFFFTAPWQFCLGVSQSEITLTSMLGGCSSGVRGPGPKLDYTLICWTVSSNLLFTHKSISQYFCSRGNFIIVFTSQIILQKNICLIDSCGTLTDSMIDIVMK